MKTEIKILTHSEPKKTNPPKEVRGFHINSLFYLWITSFMDLATQYQVTNSWLFMGPILNQLVSSQSTKYFSIQQ